MAWNYKPKELIDIDKVFDEIVPRDQLKQQQEVEDKKYADEKVKAHIKDVLETIPSVYNQNYMRWSVYPGYRYHPLYYRMLDTLREKGYMVNLTMDKEVPVIKADQMDITSVGTLEVRWDTEENPEACMSADPSFLTEMPSTFENFMYKYRRWISAASGFVIGGTIGYIAVQVSHIKGPIGKLPMA